jgi:hypothetical protein
VPLEVDLLARTESVTILQDRVTGLTGVRALSSRWRGGRPWPT